MSLLAQPRRRQVISHNPQGKTNSELWKQYGSKLMEKAGWSDGDGLGAERQGATEHLHMQFKDDNRGLGCSIEYEKNWLAHGDDFNDILATLNAHHAGASSTDSKPEADEASSEQRVGLEKKSKSAKGRIHYHKFTRGKDLSTKSADEITKIFGGNMPSSKRHRQAEVDQTSDKDPVTESALKEEKVTGLKTFQSNESMHDYFAKKMATKKGSALTSPASSEPPSSKVSTREVPPVLTVKEEPSSQAVQESLDFPKKKSKKKRVVCESTSVEITEEPVAISQAATGVTETADDVLENHIGASESKDESQRKRKIKKVLDYVAESSSCTGNSSSLLTDNGSTDQGEDSKEARRARKLARRAARELAAADALAEPPKLETCAEITVTEAIASTIPVLSAGMGENRPTFGTSMHQMRQYLRNIGPEARAGMFPGSNVFDIVGYGDQHFF